METAEDVTHGVKVDAFGSFEEDVEIGEYLIKILDCFWSYLYHMGLMCYHST